MEHAVSEAGRAVGLEASYAFCQRIARTRARNFYYSFLLLSREQRDAMCAIYAFMRYCDDISEGEGASREGIERWRGDLDLALQGRYGENALWPAFHDTVRRYRIPHEYFYQMIEGVSSDLQPKQLQTFDELYRYCYQVASVVGLTIIHIFGFDSPDALPLAEKCGIAFQLTNILRDVREDRENGRIYIPQEDIRKFGADLAKHDERFVRLMSFRGAARAGLLRRIAALDRAGASAQPSIAVGADRDLPSSAGPNRALGFRCARKAHPRPNLGKAEYSGQRRIEISVCGQSWRHRVKNVHTSVNAARKRACIIASRHLWRTHSCVPCRHSWRHRV